MMQTHLMFTNEVLYKADHKKKMDGRMALAFYLFQKQPTQKPQPLSTRTLSWLL